MAEGERKGKAAAETNMEAMCNEAREEGEQRGIAKGAATGYDEGWNMGRKKLREEMIAAGWRAPSPPPRPDIRVAGASWSSRLGLPASWYKHLCIN